MNPRSPFMHGSIAPIISAVAKIAASALEPDLTVIKS